MPPTRNQGDVSDSETRIVSELGKEFNIDEVYETESSFIGSLKSVDEFQPVEVPPNCPLNFDQHMLEEDLETQSLNNGGNNLDENNDDEVMEAEEEETWKNKVNGTVSKQNEKLYDAEGMLNPKVKRAEKKRRKKASKLASSGDAMDDDCDYDFKVDYKQGGSSMKVDENEDDGLKAEVPMAGVEFDDE